MIVKKVLKTSTSPALLLSCMNSAKLSMFIQNGSLAIHRQKLEGLDPPRNSAELGKIETISFSYDMHFFQLKSTCHVG
jgi:hypothetical protein